jgi:hypothetical protein
MFALTKAPEQLESVERLTSVCNASRIAAAKQMQSYNARLEYLHWVERGHCSKVPLRTLA